MKHSVEFDGVRVPMFVHKDMEIVNPFLSECGRFEVDPGIYGFTKTGDRAWRRNLNARWYITARTLNTEPEIHLIELWKLGQKQPELAVSVHRGHGIFEFHPYVSGL